MLQGDIYWLEGNDESRRRPVLVLTRNSGLSILTSVTVAPLTTTVRKSPTWIEVPESEGVAKRSFVNLDQIQTVRSYRLEEFITRLSVGRLREVARAIDFALGLDLLR
ncbi:MAG: type II toxin-antitoxin system PemK/MazF family toxin [Dehalococcoidia bacterium]